MDQLKMRALGQVRAFLSKLPFRLQEQSLYEILENDYGPCISLQMKRTIYLDTGQVIEYAKKFFVAGTKDPSGYTVDER